MADRPVFHPETGERLRKLREERGWSVQQAVNKARASGHNALSWNKLTWIEAGRTQFPDAKALRAISEIYAISYEQLAMEFIASEYGLQVSGRDLIRHAGTSGTRSTSRR